MNKDSKIFITGSNGLVGSSLVRVFTKHGYNNLLIPKRDELDLKNQKDVDSFFKLEKPEVVINAAAKVGGIHANNTYSADFIFENLLIQNNLFKGSFENNVKTFLFLGSSCIYPKSCPQPIKEDYLLTAPLESSNEPYAIAKIAGLKTAEYFKKQYGINYFSVMPTNLYGVNDNFHKENSHVIPGLITKIDDAIRNNDSTFYAWGTGRPKREFLYVDDLSEACLFLLKTDKELPPWINIGTGEDISIKELVKTIADEMGFQGEVKFDEKSLDGTMRKLLDVSLIHSLGWKHKTSFKEGLSKTIDFFNTSDNIRCY